MDRDQLLDRLRVDGDPDLDGRDQRDPRETFGWEQDEAKRALRAGRDPRPARAAATTAGRDPER